jgi:hypothetical protein
MSYVPHSMQIYLSAWSGALSGMGAFTRGQVDIDANAYTYVVTTAALFAQEVDTIYQPPVTDDLNIRLVQDIAQGLYAGRFQDIGPSSDYQLMAEILAAMVQSGEDYASANLPPIPVPVPPGSYLPLSGGTMTGNINMGTHEVSNLPAPTNASDAATKGYVDTADSALLPKAGGTMTGNINMGTHEVSNLPAPTNASDAATKGYVDTADSALLPKAGGTMTGDINMGTHEVSNLPAPTNASDAATKGYVDTADSALLPKAGGTMTGDINMGTHEVSNLPAPTNASDAATKGYVDTAPATNGQVRISNTSTWITFGAIQGPNLTNADQTIAISDGTLFYLLAATLSANRTKTLGTTGSPLTGETIAIARFDTSSNQLIISNGLTTIFTFPGDGIQRIAYFTYNGSRYAFANTTRIVRAT